jgi:hypothetical protein
MALRFEKLALRAFDLFAINQILQMSMILRQAADDDEMEWGSCAVSPSATSTLGVSSRYHLRG